MKKTLLAILAMSVSSAAFSADLSPACEDYFKQIDEFLAAVASDDAAKASIEMVTAQYDESKKQIAAMPSATQEQACSAASEALKQMQQMMTQQ